MKITVIMSSPHNNGTSALLADKFIAGASDAGHDVFRFNSAFEQVKPCLGCDHCMRGSKECVHDDSMNKLNNELLAADLVVLVTPLYYFGMSAQIKTVDRFYANNEQLMTSHKKAMLMATSHSADD
jgi:multimeric flavodoxin WrbA